MSFRIEDILKNDEKIKENHNEINNTDQFIPINSILEETLLNKPNGHYYRSLSEPSCVMTYRTQDYCHYDIYKTKAAFYPNPYLRTPVWPNYYLPVNFFPQFCHFSKRKGGQVRFSANQTDALEKRFTSHKYLSPEDRKLLADSLKLTDRQVKTWFQNRRAKWRRCNSVSSAEISSTRFEDKHLYNLKQSELVKSHN